MNFIIAPGMNVVVGDFVVVQNDKFTGGRSHRIMTRPRNELDIVVRVARMDICDWGHSGLIENPRSRSNWDIFVDRHSLNLMMCDSIHFSAVFQDISNLDLLRQNKTSIVQDHVSSGEYTRIPILLGVLNLFYRDVSSIMRLDTAEEFR